MSIEKIEVFGNSVSYAFGIDLGTTNSAISIKSNKAMADVLELMDGRRTLKSCLMWNGGDDFTVGQEAYEHRGQSNVVYSVKRLMGTDELIKFEKDGKFIEITPVEASSKILKKLVDSISDRYPNVKDVVITVPANFNDRQVNDTIKAGELIGLNVLSILREPTAAAIVYNTTNADTNKTVNSLVVDLGGGTFDVSLVELVNLQPNEKIDSFFGFKQPDNTGMELNVLDGDGDMNLGGDDIDDIIVKEVLLDIKSKNPDVDIDKFTVLDKEDLKYRCEKFKATSKDSIAVSHKMTMPLINGNREERQFSITKSHVEKGVTEVYKKVKVIIDRVLYRNKSKITRIKSLTLVGGSTKNYYFRELLENNYPSFVINHELEPDESVAIGAGIHAHSLKFKGTGLKVTDILPLAIGIKAGNNVVNLIKKGTQVPYSTSEVFFTQEPFQKGILLEVYQGNSRLVEECTLIGELKIDIDNPTSEFQKVLVGLNVNFNGVLRTTVRVGDTIKDVELTSIFKQSASKPDNNSKVKTIDRALLKWRNLALKFEGTTKIDFEKLLAEYESGTIDKSEVRDFIKKNRESKSFINSELKEVND